MLKSKKKIVLSIILFCFMVLSVVLGVVGLREPKTSFATGETHSHGDYTVWGDVEDEQGYLPKEAGSYYLTNNIFLLDTWTVPNGTVNLCLNGKSIMVSSIVQEKRDCIIVPEGATLNIYECDETEQDVFGVATNGGKISCLSKTERNIVVKGTLNMYGGTVFGGKTGIYLSDGTFNMYGGYITANSYSSEETDTYGGGVLIDGGSFTMNGGEICGNRLSALGGDTTLYSFGAGVYVDGEGSFIMNGGEIYGNESDYGSGIYVKNGTFTMTDGKIYGNGADYGESFGAGLYVAGNGTASLTGGKIYNNISSDKNGGAGVCCKGTLSLGGTVQIVNNTHRYEDGGRSNLSFDNSGGNYINLISPKDGMLVGISMPTPGDHFTDIEEEQDNEKYFFADREDEYVVYKGWIGLRQIKDSYRDYKIDIGTSEHGVVYSNYQGAEKALIEDGITVCLTTVPEKGYGLKSLKVKFDNGEEYDITKEKSFAMIEENATVTAEFELCTSHVDEDRDNICDICKEIIDKTVATYIGQSLTLSSDISINFYMELTEEQALNGVMKFIIGDREIIVNASNNANGYYFRCPLNTLEIATTVKAEFTYNGETVVKEYSVMDYIDTVVNGEYDAKLQALCKAIANYGYYAQVELASIHDNVIIGNSGYAEVDYHNELNVESAKTGLKDYGFTDDKNNTNIIGVGRSLSLDDKVAMNIYVQVKDGYTLTKDMITVTGDKEFILSQVEDNQYRITILNIEATNLGTNYTINIDGESITTSALAYANKVVNGEYSSNSQNAMTALYEYYESAKSYNEN